MNEIGIPADILSELSSLHRLSRQATGTTPVGDPRRVAGDDFCKLALEVRETYGVSLQEISVAIGLSRAAVYLKLKRRGLLGPLLDSQTNYQNRRMDADAIHAKLRARAACRKGHALTPDNVYEWSNARTGAIDRRCRTCMEEGRKRRRAAKRGAHE